MNANHNNLTLFLSNVDIDVEITVAVHISQIVHCLHMVLSVKGLKTHNGHLASSNKCSRCYTLTKSCCMQTVLLL